MRSISCPHLRFFSDWKNTLFDFSRHDFVNDIPVRKKINRDTILKRPHVRIRKCGRGSNLLTFNSTTLKFLSAFHCTKVCELKTLRKYHHEAYCLTSFKCFRSDSVMSSWRIEKRGAAIVNFLYLQEFLIFRTARMVSVFIRQISFIAVGW